MSRLIDADALMELVQKTHCTGCNNYNKVRCRACDIGYMLDYLDAAPTVDPWHYPSKGEYPTEGEEVFVAWTSEGSYDVVKFRYDRWGVKLSPPYAWQHIVPPKEEAHV